MENLNELLYMIRTGDEYALSVLYQFFRNLSYKIVRESEAGRRIPADILEEIAEDCSLVFPDAMETYREDMSCSFYTYAAVLIRNRMITLMRQHFTIKRGGRVQLLSLENAIHETDSLYLYTAAEAGLDDPEYVLWLHEAADRCRKAAASLTRREKELLLSWSSTLSREDSRRQLNITRKAYEGRVHRIRRKVFDKVLNSDD